MSAGATRDWAGHMKRLHVHIGRAKTGTTAIQTFLDSNRRALNEQGFEYARTGLLHINHQPLAWTLFKQAFDGGRGHYWQHARRYAVLSQAPEAYWAELRQEIERSAFDDFVISAEEFGVVRDIELTSQLFADYVDGLDVRIVVYFRRQDEFLQSVYNEAVKGKETRFAGGFWDYVQPILDIGGADCLRVVEPWAKVIGKHNLRIRVYEREQLKQGLLRDFMTTLGLDPEADYVIPSGRSNPPLQPWALTLMRGLNRYPWLRRYHGYYADLLRLVGSARSPYATHQLLSRDEQKALYARFADTNAIVARDYLGRSDGRLFYTAPAE
jgi:hypothetical protein